jgi:flagellar L-ring protein precursor FlgH
MMLRVMPLLLLACSTGNRTERKVRDFDVGQYAPRPRPANGSIFASGGLLEDEKPQYVGDVIIVRIQESDSAIHDSTTKLERESDFSFGVEGAIDKAVPAVGFANLFGTETESDLEGGGRIARRGKLEAMLPVRVKQLLPNGDLYVEGTKIVTVGNEERNLYVSGVVRPADVLADGSVLSSRIADAEISYTGEGDASDQQDPGWLMKLLGYVWPF